MADFTLKTGDTSPALTATLTDDSGTALTLTGATVQFQMRPENDPDSALTVDAPATIVDETAGEVRYDWVAGDTASPGRYVAEFDVAYADGGSETVPNAGFFTIQIQADL